MEKRESILPPDVMRELDDIGRSHVAGAMVTWVLCRQLGATFGRVDEQAHKTMKRYLAGEFRLGRHQVGNHLHVYAITHDLPEAVLEQVPWSVCHLIRKRHKHDAAAARREIEELIDCDRSLLQQRLAAMKGASGGREQTLWKHLTSAVPRDLRMTTERPSIEVRQHLYAVIRKAVETFGVTEE